MTGTTTWRTIAVSSAGDMGHAVGGALRASGFEVVVDVRGRSELSIQRAARAGLRAVDGIDAVVAECDVFLSILPPALARSMAEDVAASIARVGRTPLYADMNAVSPASVRDIETIIRAAGGDLVDGGIVGPPPGPRSTPRWYVSGGRAEEMAALAGNGIDVRVCGAEVGRASAVKMCYAAATKGTNALLTAVLVAAQRLGVSDEVTHEFETTQAELYARMLAYVPFLAADAQRFAGEMDEIAATFADAGVTPGFHQGAADLYRLLASSPLAAETRESLDRSRTLADTVRTFADGAV